MNALTEHLQAAAFVAAHRTGAGPRLHLHMQPMRATTAAVVYALDGTTPVPVIQTMLRPAEVPQLQRAVTEHNAAPERGWQLLTDGAAADLRAQAAALRADAARLDDDAAMLSAGKAHA